MEFLKTTAMTFAVMMMAGIVGLAFGNLIGMSIVYAVKHFGVFCFFVLFCLVASIVVSACTTRTKATKEDTTCE